MKFDDSSLKDYLVKHLQPLTPADPVILADYIIALLKKDKPLKELQDLCIENLVDFLGQSTQSFVSKLFVVIEDGPVALPVDNNKLSKNSEPPPNELEQVEPKPSKDEEQPHIKEEEHLSSETGSDSDELEISDDDDDRNHKHRKRGARHPSFQKNDHGRPFKKPNRKLDKASGERKLFDVSQSISRSKYENNSSLEKNATSQFEKKYPGATSVSQAPQDIGPRTRLRSDPGPRFDSFASGPRPVGGRGRGRASGPWSQHDSRFGPLGTLDFASHMIPQAPTHPGMFMGATISSVAGAQPASWGAFGFIPGMGNGCLDPVNPLGLQGALHSQLNPQLNLSIPRQRCRDFEEQGFCLRGDMCPMEHGVNRIVVEDVQSLSQFNLPVSLASSRVSGQTGPGSSTPITSSSLPMASKNMPSKIGKSSAVDEMLGFNGALSSAVVESDVYDPDQPLWNNSNPERSTDLPMDPSRDSDDKEISWDGDPSEFHSFNPPNAERPSSSVRDVAPQGREQASSRKTSRVRGSDKKLNEVCHIEQAKGEAVVANADPVFSHGIFTTTVEAHHMNSNSAPASRFRKDRHNAGKTYQKALRTLFVNGIPQKNNKREALFSHFKKFGTIVDIYIPMKSEKAFVQFSSREEAEAALKAPDAVMGNRFIKLFWANRDNLSDEQVGKEITESVSCSNKPVLSIPVKSSVGEVKESSASLAPKTSTVPLETSVMPTVVPKPLASNTSKLLLAQKKRESLEALKEELRRKQESLAKKRNDFRSQLDKLEKQTLSAKKSGPVLENAAKKQKVDKVAGVTNMPLCQSVIDEKEQQTADHPHEMSRTESNLLLADAKVLPLITKQSPKTSSRNNHIIQSLNNSEADNLFSLKVLPPLPASLANLSTLEEHFSSFHDLSSVELEDRENASSSGYLQQSSNCSAIITFTTRDSAEKAFLTGTSWQGHDLKFSWVPGSNSGTLQETNKKPSSPSTIEMLNEVQSELLNPGSLPILEADTKCPTIEIGKNTEHQDGDHEFLEVECSHDSSLPEKCMLDSSIPTIDDDNSLGTSQ